MNGRNLIKMQKSKFRNHFHYSGEYGGPLHSINSLKYSVTKEIPIVFGNGSNDHYHFIIKELVKEFENQFTYLGENTGKYITFLVHE